jgi:hypothetical protein
MDSFDPVDFADKQGTSDAFRVVIPKGCTGKESRLVLSLWPRRGDIHPISKTQ